jgi:AcrR family transcriptional regulator
MDRLHEAAQISQGGRGLIRPLEALQHVFQAHVDFVVRFPGVPRLVFQELQHGQETALKSAVRSLMAQYRGLVESLLKLADQQGALAKGTQAPAAAVMLLGSVQGLVMQAMVSGNPLAIATQAPGIFAIFLRGITLKEHP